MNSSQGRNGSFIPALVAAVLWLLVLLLAAIPILSDRRLDNLLHSPCVVVPLPALIVFLLVLSPPFRSRLAGTLPSLLVIIVVLVLLEGALRVFNPLIFHRSEFRKDPVFGGRAKPNFKLGALTTNSLGYNDQDYPFKKPAGTYRILTLGDSFAWSGFDRNYLFQLEDLLRGKMPGLRVEVINAGWPGMGPDDLKKLLELEGLRFEPDLVGLAFFVGNDFFENYNRKTVLRNGKLTHIPLPFREDGLSSRTVIKSLKRESYLLDIIRKLKTLLQEAVEKAGEARRGEPVGLMSRKKFLDFEYYRTGLLKKELTELEREEIEYVERKLLELNRMLREKGVKFFVFIIPDEVQVNEELRRELFAGYGLNGDDYDLEQPQRLLKGFCRKAGIAVFDLLPAWQAEGGGQTLYRLRDSHWNEAGNRLAAESLCEYLTGDGSPLECDTPENRTTENTKVQDGGH